MQSLKKKIEINVWNEIYVGSNYRELRGLLIDLIITSRQNKLPPTNIAKKITPSFFTLLNFNEIGCKQFNENDQWLPFFVTFKYCT